MNFIIIFVSDKATALRIKGLCTLHCFCAIFRPYDTIWSSNEEDDQSSFVFSPDIPGRRPFFAPTLSARPDIFCAGNAMCMATC